MNNKEVPTEVSMTFSYNKIRKNIFECKYHEKQMIQITILN